MNDDSFFRSLSWDLKFSLGKRSEKWYNNLFGQAGNRRAGEITPAYAVLDEATITRMAENNPDLKAVYLLRNPIERAWSSIVNGLAKKKMRSITEVTEKEMFAKMNAPGFLKRSDYAGNIKRWRSVIDRERLFIGFFEDIQHQPNNLIDRLGDFLGVRGSEVIDAERLRQPRNASRRFSAPIPPAVASKLAEILYPKIKETRELLGGYADQWFEDARKILEGKNLRDEKQ